MGIQESKLEGSKNCCISCIISYEKKLRSFSEIISRIKLPKSIYFLFILYSISITILEAILFGINASPEIQSFLNKPEYRVLEISNRTDDFKYLTVVKVGVVMDCGNYTSYAEEMVDFLNSKSIYIVAIAYCLFFVLISMNLFVDLLDLIIECRNNKESIATLRKTLRATSTVYLPFYKISVCVMCYPISNFKFNDCVEGKGQIYLNMNGFIYILAGFALFNGVILFFIIYFLQKCCFKWILSIINPIAGAAAFFLWAINGALLSIIVKTKFVFATSFLFILVYFIIQFMKFYLSQYLFS